MKDNPHFEWVRKWIHSQTPTTFRVTPDEVILPLKNLDSLCIMAREESVDVHHFTPEGIIAYHQMSNEEAASLIGYLVRRIGHK